MEECSVIQDGKCICLVFCTLCGKRVTASMFILFTLLEIKAQSSHLMCVIVKVPKHKTCVAKVCTLIAVDV